MASEVGRDEELALPVSVNTPTLAVADKEAEVQALGDRVDKSVASAEGVEEREPLALSEALVVAWEAEGSAEALPMPTPLPAVPVGVVDGLTAAPVAVLLPGPVALPSGERVPPLAAMPP